MNEPKAPAKAGIDIQSIDVRSVEATLRKVAEFQAVVRSTLREGLDYGVIPGSSKPTLLKPGAEKILMVFGLTSRYEILEAVRDYDKGFFAFTVQCTLEKNGVVVTEGLGHANTREKRYTSGKAQDPYTLANTVLKMAKKRALVDATLTVASLSEIFTQDLEDLEEDEAEQRPEQRQNGKVTEAQIRLLYARAKEKGLGQEALHRLIKQVCGVEHIRDLSPTQLDAVLEALSSIK
jgi:hypothetical protein